MEMLVLDAQETPNSSGYALVTSSLDQRVYEWVRERIIDGTLKPGARIRERALADELKVSRIPIREAFPRLESEGYLRSVHRKGVVVAPLTLRDVDELFVVRASLEVLAARLAAEQCARGASVDILRASLEAAGQAVSDGNDLQIAEATSQLHDDILNICDNRLLQDLMAPVRGRVRRLFHIATERDQTNIHTEHLSLCQAIFDGQVELAAAIAYAHIEHSRRETAPIIADLLPPE